MKVRKSFVSNSSSSSFICDSGHTKKEVAELLISLTDFWTEWSMKNQQFLDMFLLPFEATEEYVEEMEASWGPLWQSITPGQIVIESAYDNSIPYQLHDLIEHKFKAYRIHRG